MAGKRGDGSAAIPRTSIVGRERTDAVCAEYASLSGGELPRRRRIAVVLIGLATMAACAGSAPAEPTHTRRSQTDDAQRREGEPRGLGPEAINDAVRAARDRLFDCYRERVREVPGLRGRVTIRWRVAQAGFVESAELVDSTIGDQVLEECLVEEARGLVFPAYDAWPSVVVTYPFIFGEDAPASSSEESTVTPEQVTTP
jgi:hypothetical protein